MTPAAIITGAARGIGAETARALARDGINLALAVRNPDSTDVWQYGLSPQYKTKMENGMMIPALHARE